MKLGLNFDEDERAFIIGAGLASNFRMIGKQLLITDALGFKLWSKLLERPES